MTNGIIVSIILGLMVWIIYKKIKARQRGENTCGCGCSNCPSAKNCHSAK